MASSKNSKLSNQGADQETELSVLKEILAWTKISGMKQVKAILSEALDDELKRTIYQLSNGERSIKEILSKFKVDSSRTSIQRMWKQWSMIGLGESIPVMGGGMRFKRTFDAEAFGLEVKIPTDDSTDSEPDEGASNKNKLSSQEKLTETEGV